MARPTPRAVKSGVIASIKPTKVKPGSKLSKIREQRRAEPGRTAVAPSDLPIKHPDTGEMLPSPHEYVEDLLLWGNRQAKIRLKCQEKYGRACPSNATLDRLIREIKDTWLAEIEKTRTQRIAFHQRRLDKIIIKAYKSKDLRTAKDAIMDVSKLLGDLAPEKVMMLDAKDPDAAFEEVERLKKLANRED